MLKRNYAAENAASGKRHDRHAAWQLLDDIALSGPVTHPINTHKQSKYAHQIAGTRQPPSLDTHINTILKCAQWAEIR